MTETEARPQSPAAGGTHDPYAAARDRDIDAWAGYLDRKRADCLALVGRAFDLTRASLLAGETEGGVATVLFAKDEERSLAVALMNMLILTDTPFMANRAAPEFSYSRAALIGRLVEERDGGALIDDLAEVR